MTDQLPYNKVTMPEEGTPEWHKARMQAVGASESAIALGLSHWSTPAELHALKRGLIPPGEPSLAMRAGNATEEFNRQQFILETGIQGRKPDFMAVSKEYPWMACNLDFLADNVNIAAELKRSNAPDIWGESGTDEIPLDYFIQCQHTMVVTRVQRVILQVWLPYDEFRRYPIDPDPETQEKIIEGTKAFWDMVLNGMAPDINYSHPSTLDMIKRRYPTVEKEKTIALPDIVGTTIDQYQAIKQDIKALEARKDSLQAILLDRLGDAGKGEVRGQYQLTRSIVAKKPYTVNPVPYVQLRVKDISKKKEIEG